MFYVTAEGRKTTTAITEYCIVYLTITRKETVNPSTFWFPPKTDLEKILLKIV